ncbi:hypothetical protein [Pelagovum pacificum]|nr:hypothetical protein [Pelagovum pacificum]QQA45069.1 hypothetical protein I8N54_19970 [Pelagovum pacificum]
MSSRAEREEDPTCGDVRLSLSDRPDGVGVDLSVPGGELRLEDVPAEQVHFFPGLRSTAGTTGTVAESSTPVTLHMALIDTLARVLGARLTMEQAPVQGYRISVLLPDRQPVADTPALAAE